MGTKIIIGVVVTAVILITATYADKSREDGEFLEINGIRHKEIQKNLHQAHQDMDTDKAWGVLYRFEKDGLLGYKDADGNVAIEPQYYWAHSFSEGLAFVKGIEGKSNQTGFIDLEGNLVIPLPTARRASRFSEGFASITIRDWDWNYEDPLVTETLGPHIFIDRTGQDVFEQEFQNTGSFRYGFSVVTLYRGNPFFIDRTGTNVFGKEFLDASDFDEEGYARVRLLDGSRTHIDREGNIVHRGGWG